MGVSCNTLNRYRELADEDGVDALIHRIRRATNLKNRTDNSTEQAVVDYSVAFLAHDQHRTSKKLRKQGILSPAVLSAPPGYIITLKTPKSA